MWGNKCCYIMGRLAPDWGQAKSNNNSSVHDCIAHLLTNYIAQSQGQLYTGICSGREENWTDTTRNKVFLVIKTEPKILLRFRDNVEDT